jgi:hypothetical protein
MVNSKVYRNRRSAIEIKGDCEFNFDREHQ